MYVNMYQVGIVCNSPTVAIFRYSSNKLLEFSFTLFAVYINVNCVSVRQGRERKKRKKGKINNIST